MPPKKKTDVEALTFEQAMKELEDIVQQLEAGDLPLEESLALYERGQKLAGHCTSLLDRAELRVSQLSSNGLESPEDEFAGAEG